MRWKKRRLEKQYLVQSVHEVTETYSKLQTDPVESYEFYFTPCYTTDDAFLQLGRLSSIPTPTVNLPASHPYQCEITGISDSVSTEQRVRFTITIKNVKGTPLTIVEDAVNIQLNNGRVISGQCQ